MNEMTAVTQATAKAPKTLAIPDAQTVTQVKHWTDRLFSFRVTRPASLRFRSGEFVMIGLADGEMFVDDRKIYTAEKLKVGLFKDPSNF